MTQTQAMLCALTSFFLWVVVDTAIKLASQTSLSPFLIIAILGSAGALGIVGVSSYKGTVSTLAPHCPKEQILISLCAASITYASVIALKHLPLTPYYTIGFLAPLIVAGMSSLLKHEALTATKLACLVAGFLGVILAIALHGWQGEGSLAGYLAVFICVFGFSVMTVMTRKIAQKTSPESIQLLNACAVGSVGILGFLLQSTTALPDIKVLAMLVIAGGINITGNVLYGTALKHTASTNVAQTHYTQIIFGTLFGYLLWLEIPTWNLIVGSVIIIAAGLIVAKQAPISEIREESA